MNLLAKAKPARFLRQHTEDVMDSMDCLLDLCTDQILHAFGLESYRDRFVRTCKVAAFLHDFGKANSHFQEMIHSVEKGMRIDQAFRHEAISLLMLEKTELKDWVASHIDPQDILFLLWTVSGHHRKFPRPRNEKASGYYLTMYLGHSDFSDLLSLGERYGMTDPPKLDTVKWEFGVREFIDDGFEEMFMDYKAQWKNVNEENKRFLAVMKHALMVADGLASALTDHTPDKIDIPGYMKDSLSEPTLTKEDLDEIIENRLREGKKLMLMPFQRQVGECKGQVSLVQAGCGTGKTVASVLWMQQHIGKKFIFCTPTTNTALEIFRDYFSKNSLLVNSRAGHDIDVLTEQGELTDYQHYRKVFDLWSSPMLTCTADTVLGAMQNNHKGICLLPYLSNSAIVFDEIHAYDDKMFSHFLQFLQTFKNIPVLLMTASLQEGRLKKLREVLSLDSISGPKNIETNPRYEFGEYLLANEDALGERLFPRVKESLDQGKKVLWVSNTVRRTVDYAKSFLVKYGEKYPVIVYHSRFRYDDRSPIHKDLIQRFAGNEPVLVFATQVTEMSLDISSDYMVTEKAPVPALIQRMGRLNRHNPVGTKPVDIILPEADNIYAPYNKEQFENSDLWIQNLQEQRILSQRDLISLWDQSKEVFDPYTSCCMLDGFDNKDEDSYSSEYGFGTGRGSLREFGYTMPVILAEDAKLVKERKINPIGVQIPMVIPDEKKVNWKEWDQIGFSVVAEEEHIHYDKFFGGSWKF